MASDGTWSVYVSGEIHSDWRERIAAGVRDAGPPVELLAPVTTIRRPTTLAPRSWVRGR